MTLKSDLHVYISPCDGFLMRDSPHFPMCFISSVNSHLCYITLNKVSCKTNNRTQLRKHGEVRSDIQAVFITSNKI